MNTNTRELYSTLDEALKQGELLEDLKQVPAEYQPEADKALNGKKQVNVTRRLSPKLHAWAESQHRRKRNKKNRAAKRSRQINRR